MGFFDGATTSAMATQEANELQKAISAGYGTDSATFTGGRALIPENLESEVINVVAQLKEDCKVMNTIKTKPVKSTVHEVNLRTDHGDWRFLSVAEGGQSADTNQALNRKTYPMKYLQTRRSVTKQMESVETFEDALASEKLSGIEVILKGSEFQCFHGDSDIVPTEFDGFISQIRKASAANRNITSLRGATLASQGETIFDEIAGQVFDKGGFLDKALYPTVLAKDIKEMFIDRQRYIVNQPLDNLSYKAIPAYSTASGPTIQLSGESAGADKFFKTKGVVSAAGDPNKRPSAPTAVTLAANASAANSQFSAADAGDYTYKVHAVNAYGISEGVAAAAPVAVAANGSVTVTITPGSGPAATGFIICRSRKDGKVVMEMDSVRRSEEATTVYTDLNAELPGTASMIFLPKNTIQPLYNFAQLLPACTFPLAPFNTAETPFLVMMFGGLEVNAPQFCAMIKDIAYKGGLY